MALKLNPFVAKLVRSCKLGNGAACQALSLTIFSAAHFTMADADEDADHPNAMPFRGVLLLLDQASTKPPHGSRGHRILVPKDAAEKHLKSLIGMGVNYDPGNLDEHMPRHKVGVVTDAWITGNKVWVKGIIYKKDFPEAEKDLQGRRDLGMSMELANVFVRDDNEDVWYLQDFSFTGCTILRKDAAAYAQTSLAARAAATRGGAAMKSDKKKKLVVAAAGDGISEEQLAKVIASSVGAAVGKAMQPIAASIEAMAGRLDEVGSVIIQGAAASEDEDEEVTVDAAAHEEEDDDDMDAARHEDDEDDMDAAGKKSKADDEDDDEESDDDEDDSDDELDAMEDLEEKAPHSEPGEVNHAMKTKGRKTTTTDVGAEAMGKKPFPNLKSSASIAAAATTIRSLSASLKKSNHKLAMQAAAHAKDMTKMKNRLRRMEVQLQAAADATDRRTVIPVDLANLAAKSNYDLRELHASGQKLSVEQVDAMIAASGMDVEPHQKIAWKNRLMEFGLMDVGEVRR